LLPGGCPNSRAGFAAPKGSLKNNFPFYTPLHPAWLRCESSEYKDIPAFSRLAGQAPQRLKLWNNCFVNPKQQTVHGKLPKGAVSLEIPEGKIKISDQVLSCLDLSFFMAAALSTSQTGCCYRTWQSRRCGWLR
jgi:hypothetical protein